MIPLNKILRGDDMWDYTLYKFKCPYCGHEYQRTVGDGLGFRYKGEVYDRFECPNCEKFFLGKYKDGIFIKMPENESELTFCSCWMS